MKKSGKMIGGVLFGLGLLCMGLYFVFQNMDEHTVLFETNGGNSVASQKVKDNELVKVPDNPTKENNEFVEWQLNGNKYDFQTAVTKDITLTALWKMLYNVTITLDNNKYTQGVESGKTIEYSSFNLPEREGYAIKIYDASNNEFDLSTPITENLELTASYVQLQKFKVTFDSHYGTKVSGVEIYEGSLLQEPVVTRNGYTLDGWYLNNEKYDFTKPVTQNMKLVAKWFEKGKYTVTFMADGKVHRVRNVKENEKAIRPSTNPVKKGYVFKEWQLNGQEFNFDTPITSNLTIEAFFREAEKFTVSFDTDGGTNINDVVVTEGEKVIKPSNVTKNGYELAEWQSNGKTYNFNNAVTSNMTLKAIWQEEKKEYTVTFNYNDDSENKVQKFKGKVTEPSTPKRDGYKFIEWQLDGVKYDFSNDLKSNITLYAVWEELKMYEVTFDSDGGSSIPSQKIREGEHAVVPTTPTKEEATFKEWQLDGKKYDFNTAITKDITLKAVWE